MSEIFINELTEQILDVCNTDEEVKDILENLISNLKDYIEDKEYSPTHKDLRLKLKDDKEDLMLEPEVEEEDLEVQKDSEGFYSLA